MEDSIVRDFPPQGPNRPLGIFPSLSLIITSMPDATFPTQPALSQTAEDFGTMPKTSETFRTIPNSAEIFGTVPQPAESAGMPPLLDRKANHTLTVREVARMFETAGVARTERSIVNWCQPNRMGICRLDCYFDPNERKYFITAESVERAIQEERSRAARTGEPAPSQEPLPKVAASSARTETAADDHESSDPKGLRQELFDLKITNRAKDMFIEQLQKEREDFAMERQSYVERLMTFNRKVGELETRVLQLRAPGSDVPKPAEAADEFGDSGR